MGRRDKWLGKLMYDGSLLFLCAICQAYIAYENLAVVDYEQGHICYFCKRDVEEFDKQRAAQEGGGDGQQR